MDSIVLNDESIISWEKPLPKNVYCIATTKIGSTRLIEYKGIEEVKKELSNYCIIASAAKYIAEIKRAEDDGILKYLNHDGNSSQIEGSNIEQLFQGNISIYIKGIINGTNLFGAELKLSEKMNFAILDLNQTLNNILSEENIEKIILGYELKEDEQFQKTLNKSINYNDDFDDYGSYRRGHGCC